MAERANDVHGNQFILTSKVNDCVITIDPQERFDIIGSNRWMQKININIIDPNPELQIDYSCSVFYYYSIGETNGLKSFLTLPMLYLNTHNSKGETSVWDRFGVNGVIKNNVIENLDFTLLNNYILTTAVEMAESKGIEITSDHSTNQGLPSILKRMGNIIDFIIATNSATLSGFNFSIEQYFIDKNYLRFRPIEMDETIIFDDIWRYYILSAIKNTRDSISRYFDILEIPQRINRYDITEQDFNDSLNLFVKDEHGKNTNILTEEFKINQINYLNTSLYLDRFFRHFGSPDDDVFHIFNMLTPEARIYAGLGDNVVDYLNRGWQVDVQKKYLKYKKKYINLKKQLKYKKLNINN